MTSLLTNAAAMTALQTLNSINKNLETTQNRIATGERVSQASDNAAYWSISVGMKSQSGGLSAVKDSLGFGAAVVDTAYTALAEAIDLTKEILAKYVASEADGIDADAVDLEIEALKDQIVAIAKQATFEGVNLLADGSADIEVVAGYTRGADDLAEAISKIDVEAFDLEGALASAEDAWAVEQALDLMTAAAASLGASKVRIDSQTRFTTSLIDAVDRGVGELVDADLNAESARLQALQVQQQLGIQALSIANSQSQSLLTLFRQ